MSAILRQLLQCGDKSLNTKKQSDRCHILALKSLVNECSMLGDTAAHEHDCSLENRLKLVRGLHVAIVRCREAMEKAELEKKKVASESSEPKSSTKRKAEILAMAQTGAKAQVQAVINLARASQAQMVRSRKKF